MTIGLIIRDASDTPRTVTAWLVRDGSNAQKTVETGHGRVVGNGSELFFDPSGSATLTVGTNLPFVSGISHGSGTCTTGSVTATAAGGVAPYTYAWTLLDYNGEVAPMANSPSAATTTFTQTAMPPSDVLSSSWRVTATDANGNTATADVDANFADLS